jgi:hypothetical protein
MFFGAPNGNNQTGEWKKLHNEELHNLHSSRSHVARIGQERKVHKVLLGKPEGNRPLERSRCRWEVGITMDFREVGWGCVNWIQVAEDRNR